MKTLQKMRSRIVKRLAEHLADVVIVAGVGAVTRGVALWSTAGAWVTAGVLIVVAGVILGLREGGPST